MQVVEEGDAAGRVGRAGAGHRVDDHRRLLALELVDGADPRALRQRVARQRDVRVVRRDDEHVVEPQRRARPPRRRPTSPGAGLRRAARRPPPPAGWSDVLSACTVGTQRRPLPDSAPGADDALPLAPGGGLEPALVGERRRRTR